jgi:4-amino-4-deoxy-L-arabinose transferase-like glycosyltransferase
MTLRSWIWFALALTAIVALRLWHLDATGWQYDEVTYHLVARNLLHHGGLTEKTSFGQAYQPWLYQPPWYPYLLTAWFTVTGKATIYSARVFGVLLSSCSLVLAGLLIRRQRGTKVALFAVVPLAFDGWLLYVDRVSYIENLVMVVILAAFLLYQRAVDHPSWLRFAGAGALFGTAGCLKYTGVYVILAAGLCWLIVRREHVNHLIMLGVALGLFVLDQLILLAWWGHVYLHETWVQLQRVLGLRKSGGSLTSPMALVHLLVAQYRIFIPSFLIGLAGLVLLIRYLIRCYRERSWEPVQARAILFGWAASSVLVFGLSNLRLPQYFSLILIPLYLLFWVAVWDSDWRPFLRFGLVAAAVVAGLGSFWLSTHAQSVNPLERIQQYAASHIPARAVVVADEQVGDLIRQRYCREQVAAGHCARVATYGITWDTYLQSTGRLGNRTFHMLMTGATPLWSSKGFSGTVTVWKLRTAPPKPVLGIDVQATTGYPLAVARADGRRVARYIRGLGARSLGLVWNLCDPSLRSDVVRRCPESLSSPDVRAIVAAAQRAGLTVQLRPIIRTGPPSGWNAPNRSWEGFIRPRSQHAWFGRLLHAEKPYLKILVGMNGAQFVVGTELRGLASSRYWPTFLSRARQVCQCGVSVSASTGDYKKGRTARGSELGVDWYPSLRVVPNASQQAVTGAFEASLADIPRPVLARTSLDEESIRATAGAYRHPQAWGDRGRYDPRVQVRYFTAACQAVLRYQMRAVYFYEIPLNDNPAHPFTFPAFFAGRRSASAIKTCAKMFG